MDISTPVNDTHAPQPAPPDPDGAEVAPEPLAADAKVVLGPGESKSDEELEREVAALLFASSEPLSTQRLVALLERPAPARVQAALEALRAKLEAGSLPIVLRRIAGTWRLLTDSSLGDVIGRLRDEPKPERISAAALETLAIIAYRQPVSKAEIEAIRGVQAGPVLRSLVDRGLVRITGRAELPGQPLLYGTTREFLERFGLSALKDLPRDGELNED
jgi:segregation and condensation protein B